ncbi:GntR family transcriptional regulator [Acidovorax sp. Leaf76]|uniref:LacI family DNA-binding transcriptional regulator n=1 Tax=unclassified Acidovorax TaxID=2684926 RepID=UPI00070146C5|nr:MULTISPECIES: LacI family DNA-binding transcriptional regulator [unclassified Acidovorax]KQO25290.1 GntR family transcriptional regulator [Acidovorax sp. Leaf76]KQO30372.1 GntR family transcriptional regulator [Acidovorax sp. Leaf84]KQS28559.1 GntR family transcriptional regulator [Acidovorax sp. Leaf191]
MNLPPPRKPATLHDVAQAAGVSPITASRALGNPGIVSEKTRARVQQAVEATGYIPNLLAGGLKSKRSRMVAGIVPALSVSQFLPTVQSLTATLAEEGYQLLLGQTFYDAQREIDVLNAMVSRQPDGIVMMGLVQSEAARDRLRKAGVPVVETWDISDRPVDMVIGFSHLKVGSALAGYFLSRGYQRVGIATGGDQRAMERREGFLAAWGRDVPTAVVPAPSTLQLGRRALCELLAREPGLQAVVCSSDMLAHGILVEAQARGLRVPQDLAISGFGNADFSAHMVPPITTVHVDGPVIGRLAAQLIMDRCRGVQPQRSTFDLGFELIERASTAAVPG